MRRFRFTLQAVLRLRQHEEQAARLALGHALGRLAEAQRRRQHWESVRRDSQRELASLQAQGVAGERLGAYGRYLQQLDASLAQARQQVAEQQKQVSRCQAECLEAQRRRRVVERIRARQYRRYRQECERAEEAERSELALLRATRRSEAEAPALSLSSVP